MRMKTKLFIVDDHYIVVEGIRALLDQQSDIEWLGHAMNAESCLAFLENNEPDVILMDINLPGMNGIELCGEVKKKYPGILVIGLSTFNQQSFVRKMVDSGASGYVLKNATREELVTAIGTVLDGGKYYSDDVSKFVDQLPDSGIVITRREKEVLILISEGLTNAEIADKLFISVTTVDSHRKNLLTKFNTPNVAALITQAIRMELI